MNGEGPVRVGWRAGDGEDALLDREWLVANGLGGYATGTLAGVCTRRYHGLLVAALSGIGRTVMLSQLADAVRLPTGELHHLGGHERAAGLELPAATRLREFRLEVGLPVWTYEVGGSRIEKRVVMPHQLNTVRITYRLLAGPAARLELRPGVHFRPHEGPVATPLQRYRFSAEDGRYEIAAPESPLPPLRLFLRGAHATFVLDRERLAEVVYRVERSRGYDAQGDLWSPGYFRVELAPGRPVIFVASTERWEVAAAIPAEVAIAAEQERRRRLLERAPPAARSGPAAELVLAADAFVITPMGRLEDQVLSRAEGDEPRTVVAGYHWFTDWGRDTMISLEGLTLATGRHDEAGYILRTFARHVRDGLIPNLFPEGESAGLYHTADATLWMFHAMDRYLRASGDRRTLRRLLPTFEAIAGAHLAGTRFGIRVDPRDGLLTQGEEGYQLTWMDAKCEGWVVTPRRGKAVELNALWYHALRILAAWVDEERGGGAAAPWREAAERARASFNARFWYGEGGYLYDVVDGEAGDDASFRPNQIFAVSLPHAVLERERWRPVVEAVRDRLLTPVGLRSLARGHPDYKPSYHGDLRTRDAAYHQGTVWSWLIGPFVDAWLAVHPDDRAGARELLSGLVAHLADACVGSVSEVFDAEPPFTPRGCIAQAWGVAELLRALVRTAAEPG